MSERRLLTPGVMCATEINKILILLGKLLETNTRQFSILCHVIEVSLIAISVSFPCSFSLFIASARCALINCRRRYDEGFISQLSAN